MRRQLLSLFAMLTVVAAAQAGASEYFSEHVKDFGTTPRGPVLTHYFTITNTSKNTITLGQPRVSCGCVSASLLKNTLAPGEKTAVVAYMDTRRIPTAGVLKSVIVFVPFLSPTAEEVQLRVQTIARDDLVISPDSLALGTVRKGQGGKATTKVTFYSDPNWTITEATSTGAYVKASVAPGTKSGSQVAYEITAELDPTCPVGNWTADVWLKTTGAGVEKIRLPVTVNVIAPIAVNPEAVTFGSVKVGEKGEQRVILQGSVPFKVLEVKGADDALTATAVSDDARPVHILKLAYSPKKAGDLTKTLEVITDSKEQPKVTVSLTGKATE